LRYFLGDLFTRSKSPQAVDIAYVFLFIDVPKTIGTKTAFLMNSFTDIDFPVTKRKEYKFPSMSVRLNAKKHKETRSKPEKQYHTAHFKGRLFLEINAKIIKQ
jgi:hypothetical protein